MKQFTITHLVRQLIGPTFPVGETTSDNTRFENLKELCELVNSLISDIDAVAFDRNSHEFSVKRAGEYAHDYLTNRLSIKAS